MQIEHAYLLNGLFPACYRGSYVTSWEQTNQQFEEFSLTGCVSFMCTGIPGTIPVVDFYLFGL